ncbi:hypothetical protein CEXT_393201 [Caerostris extrusa]|uniref:Uncharacterized protein n=1 Tax=Caerostris extrusa TaxID=172846 RepID=A0AAV4VR25_CAEEX|nr:hypothetical protein CEXT_393201 [Caerostris extrusa]
MDDRKFINPEQYCKRFMVVMGEMEIEISTRLQFIMENPNSEVEYNRTAIKARQKNIFEVETTLNYLTNIHLKTDPKTTNISDNFVFLAKDLLANPVLIIPNCKPLLLLHTLFKSWISTTWLRSLLLNLLHPSSIFYYGEDRRFMA